MFIDLLHHLRLRRKSSVKLLKVYKRQSYQWIKKDGCKRNPHRSLLVGKIATVPCNQESSSTISLIKRKILMFHKVYLIWIISQFSSKQLKGAEIFTSTFALVVLMIVYSCSEPNQKKKPKSGKFSLNVISNTVMAINIRGVQQG